jgi:mersacidin/lichenicidin family type 2 lantibiotic
VDIQTKSIKNKEDTMSYLDIIRAWKDKEYRLSLSEEQRAVLPEHPAGLIELADAELDNATGGRGKCLNSPDRNCSYYVACNEN